MVENGKVAVVTPKNASEVEKSPLGWRGFFPPVCCYRVFWRIPERSWSLPLPAGQRVARNWFRSMIEVDVQPLAAPV